MRHGHYLLLLWYRLRWGEGAAGGPLDTPHLSCMQHGCSSRIHGLLLLLLLLLLRLLLWLLLWLRCFCSACGLLGVSHDRHGTKVEGARGRGPCRSSWCHDRCWCCGCFPFLYRRLEGGGVGCCPSGLLRLRLRLWR